MSNHLSLAQALPTDILRLILKQLVLERGSRLDEDYFCVSYLKGLLAVSSTWRQAALECLWRQLKLNISIKSNEVRLSRPKWVKNNSVPFYAGNLVKELYVTVPMSAIISGAAHRLLVDYIGDTECFHLVNKLALNIVKDQPLDYTNMPITGAHEFAKLLKSLAPAATTVQVIYSDFNRGTDYESDSDGDSFQAIADNDKLSRDSEEGVLRALVDVLYNNTRRAELEIYGFILKDLSTIDHILPLSWLKIHEIELSTVYASLVHKSASTLQFLDIRIRKAYMLIADADGEDVSYPNLQHLILDRCVSSGTYTKEISADTICFPVLRSLRLNEPYPFHDNVLFRGNSTTLEYLHFILDNETIVKLHQWRVFENKPKALQHVCFYVNNYDRDASLAIESNRNMFLSNLISGIKSVSVFNIKPLMACITTVRYGHGFQSIEMLNIQSGGESLYDVLSILKALPVLARLRCNICGLGTELENIVTEELPEHIASTYCDIGQNMQAWTMTSFKSRDDISQISDYIFLLALVCPKLWRIELNTQCIQNARAKLADALSRQPYRKYAQRLSKIIDAVRECGY